MDTTTAQTLQIAYDEQDEAEIIRTARDDPEAFSQLYRHYVTPVYRYCLSRIGNVADAEDVTAQVFIAVWESLPRYRHRGTFAAWLFTIARRRISDHFRKKPPHLALDENRDRASMPGLQSHYIHTEALQRLNDLVQRLDETQQELLRLRFAAELTYRDIARVLGKSEGAVKMALRRLLKRLEAQWGEDDE